VFRAPTARLTAAFVLALLTLGLFAVLSLRQIASLRDQQVSLGDRTRRSTLQLLRIQSTLNSLAITARDMADGAGAYEMPAYRPQADRLLLSLQDALRQEREVSPAQRLVGQQEMLLGSAAELEASFSVVFQLAEQAKLAEARSHIRTQVYRQQTALSALVSRLLVENNEAEDRRVDDTMSIYRRAEQSLLLFVAVLAVVVGALAYAALRYNLRTQRELERLSAERGDLARAMIGMQESILSSVSRELHDDFGQILTAVNTTLHRVGRSPLLTENHSLREQIEETREATREALERVRDLSQTLHPALLKTHGLSGATERYLATFQRQSGIGAHSENLELLHLVPRQQAIHVYRIIQEALSNVARHSKASSVWLRASIDDDALTLEIEDDGVGLPLRGAAPTPAELQSSKALAVKPGNPGDAGQGVRPTTAAQLATRVQSGMDDERQPASAPRQSDGGLGVIAMRERAAILGAGFAMRNGSRGVVIRLSMGRKEMKSDG
jgi:signal transduction histidine kinase